MFIKSINLQNFRSFSKREFKFSKATTLIFGPNASGKTNLLEAIYLLAAGKSFRADLESEMISYGQELSRIKGQIIKGGEEEVGLEIILTTGTVQNEKVAHKKWLINGVSKRQADFVGNLRVVYFGPEDLELVTDSPSMRRKFLDLVLIQVDREYGRAALSYEKGLRARNKVLDAIRETGAPRTQLFFWDQLLIKNGDLITKRREELIGFINNLQLSAFSKQLGVFHLEYDKSVISPQRLEQYKEEEVLAGATLVGPHRDDFRFEIRSASRRTKLEIRRNLSAYGSRGEQRLAILWLKICELAFVKEKSGELPVLLLDDIFSELDKNHRKIVWEVVGDQQTVITTADIAQIEKKRLEKVEIIELG
jgi:DNA replication and repair protein RecF